MKVKATKTEVVEVDVNTSDMFKALKTYLFNTYNIPLDACIKDGKIIVDTEYHTSHSWFEEIVVFDKPSEDQLEVMNTVRSLAGLMDKAKKVWADKAQKS